MYVYLQPFRTKELIDQANSTLEKLGDSFNMEQDISLRARYAVAAVNGLAQTVSYFAIWVFSSLANFATVALIPSFDRCSDQTGGLTVASFIATVMALSSVFYLRAAAILNQKIIDHVDASFKEMVDNYEQLFLDEVDLQRRQRKSLAAAREEPCLPEVHFEPAVKEMLEARRLLQNECRAAYPLIANAKGDAFSKAKQRLGELAVEQARTLQTTPFSRKEIDRYLVQKMALLAEESVADLYRFTIDTWSKSIRGFGGYFDREGFCRNCLELFREMKVIKQVGYFVRDVKEADDKDQAFEESAGKLRSYLADIKDCVERMTRTTPRLDWWQRLNSDRRNNGLAPA